MDKWRSVMKANNENEDALMLRFLRARKFDLQQSLDLLTQCLGKNIETRFACVRHAVMESVNLLWPLAFAKIHFSSFLFLFLFHIPCSLSDNRLEWRKTFQGCGVDNIQPSMFENELRIGTSSSSQFIQKVNSTHPIFQLFLMIYKKCLKAKDSLMDSIR